MSAVFADYVLGLLRYTHPTERLHKPEFRLRVHADDVRLTAT